MVGLSFYMAFYGVGLGPTSRLVPTEIFPTSVRAKALAVAAIIIERDSEIKLSFRSIGDFAVNKFAEEYFNGGGHKNASGGISKHSLKETEKRFLALIEEDILNTKIK